MICLELGSITSIYAPTRPIFLIRGFTYCDHTMTMASKHEFLDSDSDFVSLGQLEFFCNLECLVHGSPFVF